jgi:hypothetical protein
MANFQLIMKDEYGQTSIISSSDDIDNLIKQGKKNVNDINVENALTSDEKRKNWEAYFVEIDGNKNSKIVYSGKDAHGTDIASKTDIGFNDVTNLFLEDVKKTIKIYLGNLDGKEWYAEDKKSKKLINSLKHQDLENKIVYYIKKQ